jgi:hypothetical protein
MNKLLHLFFILTLLTLVACQEQAPRSRALVNPFGSALSEDESDQEDEEEIVVTRPTGQVVFDKGHCVCQNKKSTIISDCDTFCATKTHEQEYLYATFIPGLEITGNDVLKTTRGWCSNEILDSKGVAIDGGNPSCRLEYRGSDGSSGFFDQIEYLTNNSVRINVSNQMIDGNVYVLSLVEQTSGAKSNSVQILKGVVEEEETFPGPLQIAPVNMYTCMTLSTSTDYVYLLNAYRLHFYFVNNNTPPTVPANVLDVYCHDIQNPLYTRFDKPEYPRLETVPNIFNFWNESDPRFYDTNKNNILDVHEKIQKFVTDRGGSFDTSTTKIFFPFAWPNFPYSQIPTAPGSTNTGGQTANQNLGYLMAPWIDKVTFKAYCPNQSHYYSNDLTFQALRDLVGVNTEGLYMAIKETEVVVAENGTVETAVNDYMMIREGQLKQIWFYISNGQKYKPTDSNIQNVTAHFYWPPDPASPFIKKSNQRMYTIRHPQDLASNPAANNEQLRSNIRPSDKRFGCVPAIE